MKKLIAIITSIISFSSNAMQNTKQNIRLEVQQANLVGFEPKNSISKIEKQQVPYSLSDLTALLDNDEKDTITYDRECIYVLFRGQKSKHEYSGDMQSFCIKDNCLIVVTKKLVKVTNLTTGQFIKNYECDERYNKFLAISCDFNYMLAMNYKNNDRVFLIDNTMATKALQYMLQACKTKRAYILPENCTVAENNCALFNNDSTRIAIKVINHRAAIASWCFYDIADENLLFQINTDGPIHFIDNKLIFDGAGRFYDYATGVGLQDGLLALLTLTQRDISC